MDSLPNHRELQAIAREVLAQITPMVRQFSSERSLAELACRLLRERGITETWYHQCPALVLLGSRSCESLSGRDYRPSDEEVGDRNLITIDLSPARAEFWGDCARTIYVEDGIARASPIGEEFTRGHRFLGEAHEAVRRFARPETSFADLFAFSNEVIRKAGFENLDFLGNVGHTIATRLEDRLFITADEQSTLGSVTAFTFEPHVREIGAPWGYKHEEIYHFDSSGRLSAL